jgi:imidazoleglycerol phosphate synthase glutamine amidotransferase subunit HisH
MGSQRLVVLDYRGGNIGARVAALERRRVAFELIEDTAHVVAAIVARDNVMATQFHPEKSQRTGAVLLDNFLALAA